MEIWSVQELNTQMQVEIPFVQELMGGLRKDFQEEIRPVKELMNGLCKDFNSKFKHKSL